MKRMILFLCLLCFLNNTFSQSDTIKWEAYLYIKTFLTNPNRYLYEYQDTTGNIIIPQGKYSNLSVPDEYGFICAWKEKAGKDREYDVGFIDIHENILIPFSYSYAIPFSQNLACVERDGKKGYINRNGNVVIDFLFDSYSSFYTDGVAFVKKIISQSKETLPDGDERIVFNTKRVLIDTLGNEIINEKHPYQSIKENFKNDHFLWIQKDDKWAFFDPKGNQLTPFIFDAMHPANVCAYKPNLYYGQDMRWFYKGLTVVEKDKEYAILNENMEYVVPFGTYQWISPMSVGGLMIVKENNKYGLVNHQLKLMQPIEFDLISNEPAIYHEQNFPSFWAKKNGKYYIFDTLGYWKDSIEYDNIKLLQANFYLVTKDENQWRMDRYGAKIIEDFTIIKSACAGFVASKDSLFGLVDVEGKIVIPFEYEDIFCDRGTFVKKEGKWGTVNEELWGNEKETIRQFIPCKYDYITYAWDDSSDSKNYIVVQNDKFGKVTETGIEIFPCLYDGITTWVEYGPNGHYVMIGNKMGLIDYSGNLMIPILYDNVTCLFGTKWAEIYDNGKMGLCDKKNGTLFLPLEYDYIYVDAFWMDTDKPIRIVTYKDSIVDILDEKGNILQSDVSERDIKEKYDINISQYYTLPCSYELLLMMHNRTFNPPDCMLEIFKTDNQSIESIYYNME
ncbi:WG repeat-containing protein [Bacteroidales bacterium OttesenSCG-928-B11]|nr:WG repeat-containing protein [Bacteroidales bacterium OttesenSCG-928-E04]MDL2311401.1 WG repeat-containing protein [Bacteroidales bacterium OttesenSCG-928-B11]MDL2325797.1 WG repeat-containing protein [Bacteroidales bacterium OttesenSCG-928-A14]